MKQNGVQDSDSGEIQKTEIYLVLSLWHSIRRILLIIVNAEMFRRLLYDDMRIANVVS